MLGFLFKRTGLAQKWVLHKTIVFPDERPLPHVGEIGISITPLRPWGK